MAFHDFAEYQRLVKAASEIDGNTYLIVLLGGEAGLRCGEMMALAGSDVDFEREYLVVERSEWKGHVTVPKGGRGRRLRLTVRLRDALQRYRHLRSRRVLCERSGVPLRAKRCPVHAKDGAESGTLGRAASRRAAQRGACAAAYVLLTFSDARGGGDGDSGTSGTRRSLNNPALHAFQSQGC